MSQAMIDYAVNTVLPTIGEMAHHEKLQQNHNNHKTTKGFALALHKGVVVALPIPEDMHPEAFTAAQKQTFLIKPKHATTPEPATVTVLTWLSFDEALSFYAESGVSLCRIVEDLKDAFHLLDPDNDALVKVFALN